MTAVHVADGRPEMTQAAPGGSPRGTPPARRGLEAVRRVLRVSTLLWAHALVWAFSAGVGVLALGQLRTTTAQLDAVVTQHAENLLTVERLRTASERVGRSARGYLLTGHARHLAELERARAEVRAEARALHAQGPGADARLARLHALAQRHEQALLDVVEARRRGEDAARLREERAQPLRDALDGALAQLGREETLAFEEAHRTARASVVRATRGLWTLAAVALLLALGLTALLFHTLAQLRRARARQEEVNRQLEATNRELDAFAGRVAHDVRNLLAPVALQAASLRARPADAAAVEGAAGRLERLALRADAFTRAMLDYARAGAPGAPGAQACVPHVVADALEDLSYQAAALEGLQVRQDLQDVRVACPPALLHAVVMNLLGNAFKFLAGQPRREVWLRTRVGGAWCELDVADSGPGIPEAAQARLFTPFYRVPGTEAAGTGLGLATVRRLLHSLGGDVQVRSRPGQGTTFTVRLPLAAALPAPAAAPVPAA